MADDYNKVLLDHKDMNKNKELRDALYPISKNGSIVADYVEILNQNARNKLRMPKRAKTKPKTRSKRKVSRKKTKKTKKSKNKNKKKKKKKKKKDKKKKANSKYKKGTHWITYFFKYIISTIVFYMLSLIGWRESEDDIIGDPENPGIIMFLLNNLGLYQSYELNYRGQRISPRTGRPVLLSLGPIRVVQEEGFDISEHWDEYIFKYLEHSNLVTKSWRANRLAVQVALCMGDDGKMSDVLICDNDDVDDDQEEGERSAFVVP